MNFVVLSIKHFWFIGLGGCDRIEGVSFLQCSMCYFTKVIIRIAFRRERFQIKQEKYRPISFRVKTTINEIFMSQGLAV